MKRCLPLVLVVAALLWTSRITVAEVLHFGVLATDVDPASQRRWEHLGHYLNQKLPDHSFSVHILDGTALRTAIRQGRMDFVLTEPSEFVRMTHEAGLAAPLATVTDVAAGKPLRVVGGAIVTRQEMADIQTLKDLRGRRIAVANRDSFEGYQLQAYTLQLAGVPMGELLVTGEPQDNAMRALLDGRVDAAFVRNGLIEQMVRDKRLKPGTLRVVGSQTLAGYPYASSTKLYPQWPVLAMPHVREEMSVRVSGALLSLPRGSPAARDIGIHGFSLPAEYESVRQVMRTLQVPPFDNTAGVSLRAVWDAYWGFAVAFLAGLLAFAAMAVRAMVLSRRLGELNASLELRVQARTSELASRNAELDRTLKTLSDTRDELVQSAKLASLGSLVAGVAHELNTPIGNGLMVATSLQDRVVQFRSDLQGNLRRSVLEQFMSDLSEASEILSRSLQRAATLVSSFKQVSVDQTSSQRRRFDLFDTLEEIATTLSPMLRKSGCELVLPQHSEPMPMDSYPGPLGQVVTNLINNAVVHGYGDGPPGTIRLQVRRIDANTVVLGVQDHGQGISPANIDRVFDPFFTTRLGQGGSGLGLHIVHNIVVGTLGGKVSVESQPGHGAAFTLQLPLVAPQPLSPDRSLPTQRHPDSGSEAQ